MQRASIPMPTISLINDEEYFSSVNTKTAFNTRLLLSTIRRRWFSFYDLPSSVRVEATTETTADRITIDDKSTTTCVQCYIKKKNVSSCICLFLHLQVGIKQLTMLKANNNLIVDCRTLQ